VRLDEDEIDALAQAGAVVLRWIVLALGVVLIARVLVGCGGDQFTVSVFPDAGGAELVDGAIAIAPELVDGGSQQKTRIGSQSRNDGSSDAPQAAAPSEAAAPSLQEGGTLDPPPVDAGAPPPPPVEAGAPPPPPALCCLTPCSGSTPAAITCGNGPAWTCAAGSCSDRACAVGAACAWMSVCAGRVEVCP